MHDLIRRYAADRAAAGPAADREQALGRLLDYYQHTAARAEALLARQTPAAPAPAPAAPGRPRSRTCRTRARALAWARAERASLLACLDHAARAGAARPGGRPHRRPGRAAAPRRPLGRGHHPPRRRRRAPRGTSATGSARPRALHHLGIAAAADRGLPGRGSRSGGGPGHLPRPRRPARPGRRPPRPRASCGTRPGTTRARPRCWRRPWASSATSATGAARPTPCTAWGTSRRMGGDYPGAARALEEALGIFRDLGDRHGQAERPRLPRGRPADDAGTIRARPQALEEALGIFRDLGDRPGQASVLLNLGAMRRRPGTTRARPGRWRRRWASTATSAADSARASPSA